MLKNKVFVVFFDIHVHIAQLYSTSKNTKTKTKSGDFFCLRIPQKWVIHPFLTFLIFTRVFSLNFDTRKRSSRDEFVAPKMETLMHLDVLCTLKDPHKHYMVIWGTQKFPVIFDLEMCGISTLGVWIVLYDSYIRVYGFGKSSGTSELFSLRFAVLKYEI